jgi:hypothetical protein
MTQSAIVVANEARIRQFNMTKLTAEALRMPACIHCLNDTPNDNVTALVAVRRKKDTKIFLAIFSSFELVENSILKGSEALSATKKILINF